MRSALGALAIVTAILLAAPAAEAIEFSRSSTTGKGSFLIPLHAETPMVGPVSVDLGVQIAPFLSDLLGPANLHAGYSEVSSSLFDANANAYWHVPVLAYDLVGHHAPWVAPYMGYRYMGVFTSEAALSLGGAGAIGNVSQLSGLNYGVRAEAPLPFGFHAYAHAGLTTLLGGGWDSRANGLAVTSAGRIGTAGTTLASAGLGAGWSFFDLLALSVGYEVLNLPTGMRSQGPALPGGQTTVNNLSVGARLLVLSF